MADLNISGKAKVTITNNSDIPIEVPTYGIRGNEYTIVPVGESIEVETSEVSQVLSYKSFVESSSPTDPVIIDIEPSGGTHPTEVPSFVPVTDPYIEEFTVNDMTFAKISEDYLVVSKSTILFTMNASYKGETMVFTTPMAVEQGADNLYMQGIEELEFAFYAVTSADGATYEGVTIPSGGTWVLKEAYEENFKEITINSFSGEALNEKDTIEPADSYLEEFSTDEYGMVGKISNDFPWISKPNYAITMSGESEGQTVSTDFPVDVEQVGGAAFAVLVESKPLFVVAVTDDAVVEDLGVTIPTAGTWVIEAMYSQLTEGLTGIKFTCKENAVVSLEVVTMPSKTSYYIGEYINYDGIEVEATYEDGSSKSISQYDLKFTPESYTKCDTAGSQTVTVSYGGQSTTFNVSVIGLASIEITQMPTDTSIIIGSNYTYDGLVVSGTFADGAVRDITYYCTYSPEKYSKATTLGDVTVTVSLAGISATFTIKVVPIRYVINTKYMNHTWEGGQQIDHASGFTLTTARPTDWDTNFYKLYFTKVVMGSSGEDYTFAPVPEKSTVPDWAPDTYYSCDETYLRFNDDYGYFKASDDVVDATLEKVAMTQVVALFNRDSSNSPTKTLTNDYAIYSMEYNSLLIPRAVCTYVDNVSIPLTIENETVTITFPTSGTYFYCKSGSGDSIYQLGTNEEVSVSWDDDFIDLKKEVNHFNVTKFMDSLVAGTSSPSNRVYRKISGDQLLSSEYDGYYTIVTRTDLLSYGGDVIQFPSWEKDFLLDVNSTMTDWTWMYHNYPYSTVPSTAKIGFVTSVDDTQTTFSVSHSSQYDTITSKGTYIKEDPSKSELVTSIYRTPSSNSTQKVSFDINNIPKRDVSDYSGNTYEFYKVSDNFIPVISSSNYHTGAYGPSIVIKKSDNSTIQINSFYNVFVSGSGSYSNATRVSEVFSTNSSGINTTDPWVLISDSGEFIRSLPTTSGSYVNLVAPSKGVFIVAPKGSISDWVSLEVSYIPRTYSSTGAVVSSLPVNDWRYAYDDNGNKVFAEDDNSNEVGFDITTTNYKVTLGSTVYDNLPTSGITKETYRNTVKFTIPVTAGITITMLSVSDPYFEFNGEGYKVSKFGTYASVSDLTTYNSIRVEEIAD